jgi:hypothetical protein
LLLAFDEKLQLQIPVKLINVGQSDKRLKREEKCHFLSFLEGLRIISKQNFSKQKTPILIEHGNLKFFFVF